VGLSAGTGLGVSSALVASQVGINPANLNANPAAAPPPPPPAGNAPAADAPLQAPADPLVDEEAVNQAGANVMVDVYEDGEDDEVDIMATVYHAEEVLDDDDDEEDDGDPSWPYVAVFPMNANAAMAANDAQKSARADARVLNRDGFSAHSAELDRDHSTNKSADSVVAPGMNRKLDEDGASFKDRNYYDYSGDLPGCSRSVQPVASSPCLEAEHCYGGGASGAEHCDSSVGGRSLSACSSSTEQERAEGTSSADCRESVLEASVEHKPQTRASLSVESESGTSAIYPAPTVQRDSVQGAAPGLGNQSSAIALDVDRQAIIHCVPSLLNVDSTLNVSEPLQPEREGETTYKRNSSSDSPIATEASIETFGKMETTSDMCGTNDAGCSTSHRNADRSVSSAGIKVKQIKTGNKNTVSPEPPSLSSVVKTSSSPTSSDTDPSSSRRKGKSLAGSKKGIIKRSNPVSVSPPSPPENLPLPSHGVDQGCQAQSEDIRETMRGAQEKNDNVPPPVPPAAAISDSIPESEASKVAQPAGAKVSSRIRTGRSATVNSFYRTDPNTDQILTPIHSEEDVVNKSPRGGGCNEAGGGTTSRNVPRCDKATSTSDPVLEDDCPQVGYFLVYMQY